MALASRINSRIRSFNRTASCRLKVRTRVSNALNYMPELRAGGFEFETGSYDLTRIEKETLVQVESLPGARVKVTLAKSANGSGPITAYAQCKFVK